MEFLILLLALVALIWAFKNHIDYGRLEEKFARLERELAKTAAAPVPPPSPEETTPEEPPVIAPPPPREEARPRVQPPTPPEPARPLFTPRAPQAKKPAFDWEALVGVQLF